MKYEKNQCYEIRITDYSDEGLGIGRAFSGLDVSGSAADENRDRKEGLTVFVKDTVVGDLALVRLTKVKKTYAYGRLEKLLEKSPDRVEPLCPDAARCGGCQIQMMDYQAALAWKAKKVRNMLVRIGGFGEEEAAKLVQETAGMDDPWHYRNKAQYPVGTDKEGRPAAGFYAGRTHDIIPRLSCAIGDPVCEIILSRVLAFMGAHSIAPYDEKTGKGDLRHVVIRSAKASGTVMVCLVTTRKALPGKEILAKELLQIPGVVSVCQNINPDNTNVILGKETIVLAGEERIIDRIGEVSFSISAKSFYQVNPVQTKVLYDQVSDFAALTGKETLWDLYCGIGTISLFLAGKAKEVYGVEIVPEAIRDAEKNAELNHIENARFFVGRAEDVLPEKYEKEAIRADVIVVDPPRKGCERSVLDTMIRMKPERIVYVSCDPATLARDLKILREGGYEVKSVQPVDMFPQTVHVETVALLSKLSEEKHHIEVKVDMDELDLTSTEAKATYKDIQDWVQEKYGFHVTNLNIAQVKQKHGIIERENYNKPKSEDSKQPGCPKDKVEAIEDAMRHFQMI